MGAILKFVSDIKILIIAALLALGLGLVVVAANGVLSNQKVLDAILAEREDGEELAEIIAGMPTCTVSLTINSFRVLNDTEIGQEEWEITTWVLPGGGFGKHTLNADESDGLVTIGVQLSAEVLGKALFPISPSLGFTYVTEIDGGGVWNETGMVKISDYRLDCPDSRTIKQSITGTGVDLFLEDFKVDVELLWKVVEN